MSSLLTTILLFLLHISVSVSNNAELANPFLATISTDEAQQLNRCGAVAENAIAKCLEPMLSYANDIQLEDSATPHDKQNTLAPHQSQRHSPPFSLQGGDVFRRLCSLYTDFKTCVNGIDCTSMSLKAVDASYGYMCGSGHKQFEKHADCFAEVEGHDEYVRCRREAAQAMDRVSRREKEPRGAGIGDQYLHGLCSAMDDYLRCCRPFVVRSCGQEAWTLVAKITRESLLVSLPDCDLEHALLDG